MFIVDSQVHIWREETADRPWVPGARERIRLNGHREDPFSYAECLALMDEAGVNRALIIPPSWEGDRIDYALEACEAHPERFGIMARCVDDAIGYWAQETADLYPHRNIYVKVSAIPGYSTHPFPNLNIAKYVREMVDKMGPERCFWGTDLTRLMRHGLTYTDTIEQFTKHFPFTEDELEWIMGRGICECLNWPVPVTA